MKIWLDDIRPAPDGYVWCRSVNEVIGVISNTNDKIELIDCDQYARDGGDGIKLLDWLAEHGLFYKIYLHTMNPVGKANMERLIRRYWKE